MRIWTRWVFFLCATVLNLLLVYVFVPPERQKGALVFVAGTVAITGFLVLRLQRRARQDLIVALKGTKIPGWGSPAVFEQESVRSAEEFDERDLGVWRREGHEIWMQRRSPRRGLGKAETVVTASLKPSFDANVLISRSLLPSELKATPGLGSIDADMEFTKSFTVQAQPPKAADRLLDTETWKAIGRLSSLQDPLHSFVLRWRDHKLVVIIEGELEDTDSASTFLLMSFKLIERLVDLGLQREEASVGSFMRKVLTVAPSMSVRDAARLMASHDVGSAIVSADGKLPLGIFTERDVCRHVVAERRIAGATPVSEVMSRQISAIVVSEPIQRAYAVLSGGRFRHVPVLDGRDIVGMVSQTDLFRRLYRKWETSEDPGRLGRLACHVLFTRPVVTTTSDALIADAASLMREHDIGAVVVRDGTEGAALNGIITERDICRRVVAGDLDFRSAPVSRAATVNVACLSVSDPVEKALRLLSRGQFRHVPITGVAGLTGILSVSDLVKALEQDAGAPGTG